LAIGIVNARSDKFVGRGLCSGRRSLLGHRKRAPRIAQRDKLRAAQNEISFKDAMGQLEDERLMWVYLKTQPKFNVAEIFKHTDDQIKQILDDNKLTREKFDEILMRPPYLTTYSQYRYYFATVNAKKLLQSSIGTQIFISDEELKEELRRTKAEESECFDVVFLSVLSKVQDKNKDSAQLTAQFKKAYEIRSHIGPQTSWDELKERYGDDKSIEIMEPISYEKGVIKPYYDNMLAKAQTHQVTEPFKDGNAVTMIWKIKRQTHDHVTDHDLLEKRQKKLYEAVDRKINAEISAMKDGSTTIVKGCRDH